jgi:hypothetical protein
VSEAPARILARRVAPVALAVVAAALGATILPFWPPVLVAALVVGAGLATLVDPRIGLAVALAAPVFPLGNYADSAAVLYGAFALGWLALCWRDARWGLLYLAGPLLSPLGLLALVPLAVQPARGALRRGAQAALAVLAAVLVASVSGGALPITDSAPVSLGISPLDSAGDAAQAVWHALTFQPAVLAGAAIAATVAATLPMVRRRSRYGVPTVGAALVAASVAAGAGIGASLVAVIVWAIATIVVARTRR